MKKTSSRDRYVKDIFTKLGVSFKKGSTILDVGCGDGIITVFFREMFGLKVYGIDIYKSLLLDPSIKFKKGSIYKIPFNKNTFDYIFLKNIVHHVDEPRQRKDYLIKALLELKRVCKKNGKIIIIEANRYNPLFYPHMVIFGKHDHFRQSYFISLVNSVFPIAGFKFFEAHLYPFPPFIKVFKLYERLMEMFSPRAFLAYNVAIITNE